MGIMAGAALEAGGEMIGVLPTGLFPDGVTASPRREHHSGNLVVEEVPDMHARKARFHLLSDAFLVLPGGLGTLEEMAEIATWAQIGIHDRPIGFLDVEGFYDALFAWFDRSVADGFLRPANRALLHVDADLGVLLKRMAAQLSDPPPAEPKWIDAVSSPLAVGGSVTERRIQTSAVTTTLVGTLPVFLTGALAVQIGRDIPFEPTRIGIASGVFFGAAATGSALMGRLAERVGPGRAMRTAAGGSAVLMGAMAIAPSYGVLLCILLLAGYGNALAQVGSNLLVARAVAPARQGWALALKQAGVPAGTLLGGLAVPRSGSPSVGVGPMWRGRSAQSPPPSPSRSASSSPEAGDQSGPADPAISRWALSCCWPLPPVSPPVPTARWRRSSSAPGSTPGWASPRQVSCSRSDPPPASRCACSWAAGPTGAAAATYPS